MTTSKRVADRKSAKFQKNIFKRGNVPDATDRKSKKSPVPKAVLFLFIFVVVGSGNILDRGVSNGKFNKRTLMPVSDVERLGRVKADTYSLCGK